MLVGPTAVGKSALALALAPRFGADIVTADSRQVYRYMDVGTAKPKPEEQAAVRHYMIDLAEPSETYTAGAYQKEASRVLDRLAELGRLAFVVGGTGFYIRALLDGLTLPSVPPDPELRARLRSEAAAMGAESLHSRLAELDPVSADRIHPNNVPRVIRALEVVAAVGGPVPSGQGQVRRALYIGLRREPARLKEIAGERVIRQVRDGLADETRLLLAMGYDPATPALSGFGYREMIRHLRNELTLAEAISAYQTATYQYIRRQMTWFHANPRIHWLEPSDLAPAASLIERWFATGASG